MSEPANRFIGKAAAYSNSRPTYPQECLDQIIDKTGLGPAATVYDIGAGTGLFTQLLLNHFEHIHMVEPNREMGEAALVRLPIWQITLNIAPAESFPAKPDSIDLITAAQAFHWFEQEAAKLHWQSLLRETGYVALVWNDRVTPTPFAKEFSEFLHQLANRDPNNQPPQEGSEEEVLTFFRDGEMLVSHHSTVLNEQELIDLAVSRSYFPRPGHQDFEPLKARVAELFARHQTNQTVEIPYQCKLFIGQI